MASFDQDLIIFEDDTLMLQYTFTDLEGTFNSSYAAWWGASPTSTWNPGGDPPASTTPTIEKFVGWNGVSPGPSSTSTGDITVVNGDTIVRVFFKQADFVGSTAGTLDTNTEYCCELVISDNGSENNSVVAAVGKLYVSASIFSAAGYRPT